MKNKLMRILVALVAILLYSAGISLFLDPNDLAPGGVSGISIILNRLIRVETGTLILLINLPLLAVGLWKFGVRFAGGTGVCILLTGFLTNRMAAYGPVTRDPLLAALAGSGLLALGMGMIFKAGATTGGTDIIVKLLRLKLPHIRTGALFLGIDSVIVICSGLVFGDPDKALYAALAAFFTSQCLDLVLYGRDEAKMIYIISDYDRQITQRLLEELDIGVTHLSGRGAYSGKEKQIILCVLRKQLAPRVESIVREEDDEAFLIVTKATEIYGKGYKSYFSEKI